jgi:hypothetical protein
MSEFIIKLFKSKNPIMVAVGIIAASCIFIKAMFGVVTKADIYISQFETKEDHKADIEQKVNEFKKDVRIAILENNKVLLDEWEKRSKR